jgi:4-hydroxybenzoate polyprenyltransferase
MVSPAKPARGLAARLWEYQAERFPVIKHGALIVAFGASAVCLSALLRGPRSEVGLHGVAVAVLVLFLLFFQLRVADEHKDAADDAKYRPERPVPRGLVSLGELRGVAIGAGLVQVVLAASLDWQLLGLLAVVWAWMALMTREFFAPDALRKRPILYMVSHMMVMPLIDLFATACDWLPAGADIDAQHFGPALGGFLALSFFNGTVLEIARKSWAPEQEREGVESYSKLWRPGRAGVTVAAMMFAGFCLSVFVHLQSGAHAAFLALLMVSAMYAMFAAIDYAGTPTVKKAKGLETASGVFVLSNYLLLGVLPLIARLLWPA